MKVSISIAQSMGEEDPSARHYTKEQIEALPEFNMGVSERAFKVRSKQGFIAFDNQKGLGETPNNRNIIYKGCVAILSIDKLLRVLPGMEERQRDSFKMLDLIKRGFSIASPFIELDIDSYVDGNKGLAQAVGHEGRARVWALHKLGVKEIPVQLQFSGYRARHVKDHDQFIAWLNDGLKLEKSSRIEKGLFKEVLFG